MFHVERLTDITKLIVIFAILKTRLEACDEGTRIEDSSNLIIPYNYVQKNPFHLYSSMFTDCNLRQLTIETFI
jgi:hypothetical protein